MSAVQRNIAYAGSLIGRPFCSLLLLALALAPIAFHPLGIGRDYPNHLARVFIQGAFGHQPTLQQSYQLNQQAIPDLAMDLLVGPFVGLINIYTAATVFSVFAVALLPVGGTLLHFVLYRRWSLWPLACLPALYSAPLAGGLINFLAGVGLSLVGFSGWIAFRQRSRWLRLAIFLPLVVVLWFWHALGFLALGYMVLAYEVARALHQPKHASLFCQRELLLQSILFMVPLVVLIISFLSLGGLPAGGISFGSPMAMLINFTFAFGLSDLLQGIIVLAVVAVILIALRQAGALAWHPDIRAPVIAVGLLVLFIPEKFLGISLLQLRFPALFIFLLFAGSQLTVASVKVRSLLAMLFLGLFAWQWSYAWQRMASVDRVQREMTVAFAGMSEGSWLLTAWPPEKDRSELVWNELYHSSSLAVIEAMVFEPKLFTNTSRVNVRAPLSVFNEPQAYPAKMPELLERAAEAAPNEAGWGQDGAARYFDGWPGTFDYLLWLGRQPLEAPADWKLTPVATNPEFTLYRIN